MITGANEFESLEDILTEYAQEDIFEHCGLRVFMNKKLLNPFRNDTNPKCYFEWFEGMLYFYDFTRFFDKVGINCFDLLKYVHPELDSKKKIATYIRKNIKPTKNPEIIIEKKKEIVIKIETGFYPKKHYLDLFPADFLLSERAYYVAKYWASTKNDEQAKLNRFYNPDKVHCYAFHFEDTGHVKLYAPELPKTGQRFYTNCTDEDVWGFSFPFQANSNVLLITKGPKDYLTLRYCFTEFDIMSVQSEYSMLDSGTLELIRNSYDEVYVVFDPDDTGVRRRKVWEELYGFKTIPLDQEIGDSFDYLKKKGKDFLRNTIFNNL